MENTLFIIDGNSILYREFFAMPGLTNRHGEFTGAVFGFAKVITEILTRFKPSHIAVAFDAGKHTFRNDIYEGYKATRKPMPEDLRSQLEPVKSMLEAMKIKIVEQKGIEGDDVIGSLAKKFHVNKVIITGDRDSYQLVAPDTVVYLNKKGLSDLKILDETAIKAEFGLTPEQMVFVKALQGDTSDNIPGVRGVGEKTALNLIQKYGDLDGVYAHLDEIKGVLHSKLVEDRDQAYMSLELARIKTDAKLDVELDDLMVVFPYPLEVKQIFAYNDFRSLMKREEIYTAEFDEPKHKTVPKREVQVLSSIDEVNGIFECKKELGFFVDGKVFHFSDGVKEYVYEIEVGTRDATFRALKNIMEDERISKVLFDSKSDRHEFKSVGVEIRGEYFDCMIAKHLVIGDSVTKIEDILEDPIEKGYIASELVSVKGELIENLERMGMMNLYNDLELPLSYVLFDMECAGFKVDVGRLQELDQKYETEVNELIDAIYEVVGREFNINSPKQLAEIIYDELKLSNSKKKSTASEVLEEIADRHPLIPLIIRYRKVAKFSSSFIKNLYSHLDSEGYVHTKFNQTLTTTGRLSSSEPNLQNIPIRGEESREIRSMFVARSERRVLVDVDYSQIELRILAHVTGDELLLKAFNEGLDIHTQTASAVFGVPELLVTPDMRRQAKVVNFGVVYGISDFGLATDLKITVLEARQYIDNFFRAHPKLKEFMNNAVHQARETGRVTTVLGRTRRMTDINSSNYQIRTRAERASYNMPIQGTSADIIKLAMVKVFNALKQEKLDARLIMQVHDELIVDSAPEVQDKVMEIVKDCMKNAMEMTVKLEVDGSIAHRWSEGH